MSARQTNKPITQCSHLTRDMPFHCCQVDIYIYTVCIGSFLSTQTLAHAHIYGMKCTYRSAIIADRKSMSFGFCYLRRSVTHTYGLHTPGSSVYNKKQRVDIEMQRQTNKNKKVHVNQCWAHRLKCSKWFIPHCLLKKRNQNAYLIITENASGFIIFVFFLSFGTFCPSENLTSRAPVPPLNLSSHLPIISRQNLLQDCQSNGALVGSVIHYTAQH